MIISQFWNKVWNGLISYILKYLLVCRTTSLMRFKLKNKRKYCRGDEFRGGIFFGPGLPVNSLSSSGSGGMTRNQTPAILIAYAGAHVLLWRHLRKNDVIANQYCIKQLAIIFSHLFFWLLALKICILLQGLVLIQLNSCKVLVLFF